ncbi:MAG: L,D-transpeptidase family protein [Pseudomonadota bacterium]
MDELVHTGLPSDRLIMHGAENDVVGQVQILVAREEDTLPEIARRYDLGYEEIVSANPGVDPWLPKEGTPIVLPTQFVLPSGPRTGIVLNLASMRLFYFPRPDPGQPQEVITHPIGIGRVGWSTPIGETVITAKARNPVWYVPASVRREHEEAGDPLPAVVHPGPDNPLGKFAMRLDIPGYLIHGTNKPFGVGMRVSHGCIRLYPEDIARLYERVPKGTPVRIVNEPYQVGWLDGELLLEAHTPLEDDDSNATLRLSNLLAEMLGDGQEINYEQARLAIQTLSGVPVSILAEGDEVHGSVEAKALNIRRALQQTSLNE